MRVINVTYNNIYSPNINNHLYPKDIWEKALNDIKSKEFWVVSEPAELVELKDAVGRVTDFYFHEDKDSITFEIYVHQDWIDIDKMYFCLFGTGDTYLEDINKDVVTVKHFNLIGMFLADGCAWDYQVELVEEIEENQVNKETIDLIKTSHFMPTIENGEIKSIDVIAPATTISKEDDSYMNNTSILKPCPFCGADAHIWLRNNQERSYVRYMAAVECNNMYCEAMIDTQWFDAGDEAIQEAITCWNRRVE